MTAPDAGFGIIAWIDGIVDGRKFYAQADVQRAYGRDGFAGIVARCDEAFASVRQDTRLDDLTMQVMLVWSDLRDAADGRDTKHVVS